jgi:glycoside/pentoside/hexuronide:cation symporter, GPH family
MSEPTAGKDKLSTGTVALYALPNIPHSLALLPVVNFVPAFYSDELALPLGLVGLMLFLTRLTDIVTDPVIGAWSDRTRTRIGRRKPFILAGLPILCLAVWFVFVPMPGANLTSLFFGLFFIYLGFTIVDLPYNAWGAELSSDYDERSRVSAWRGAAGSVGTLAALSIPLALQAMGRPGAGEALFWMAVFFIIIQPLAFLITIARLPERPADDLGQAPIPFVKGLRLVMGNAPFVRLLVATSFIIAAMAIGATLNLLMFKHVIGAAEAFPTAIFLQNVAALIGVPIWMAIASRHGKHIAMAIAAAWIAACLALSFIWTRGDVIGFSATMVALGLGLGGLLFLAQALTADVTDQDLLDTGRERTATFYAVLGMGTKAAIAVGVLIGTAVPSLVGFQPSDATHSATSLLGVRAVYAFAGLPLMLVAVWLLWRYPLTRELQAGLRAAIAVKRAQTS